MAVATSSVPPALAGTRDRLLASAAALLAEHGSFEGVSLRSIAAGAGVSPTAVYRHFDDHAHLLESLAAWCWEQFDGAVFGATGTDTDPAERLLAQGRAYIAFAKEHPAIYRVLFESRFDGVHRFGDGSAVFAKLVAVIDEILERRGDSRPPVRVAALVYSWIHGVATSDPPPLPGYPTADEQLIEIGLLLGIASSSPDPGSSEPTSTR